MADKEAVIMNRDLRVRGYGSGLALFDEATGKPMFQLEEREASIQSSSDEGPVTVIVEFVAKRVDHA